MMLIDPFRLAAPSWRTVFESADGANAGGWSGYTHRHVLLPAFMLGGGVRVRVTGAGTSGFSIGSAFVGVAAAAGDVYDFAATPVQMYFGGQPGAVVAGSSQLVADPADITFDGTRALVFAFHYAGSTGLMAKQAAQSSRTRCFYSAAVNSAATVNPPAGMTETTWSWIRKIELFG